jgi:hypothetical protein
MAGMLPVLSVGDIARQHGVSLHRVLYVIRSRDIRPAGMAGNTRVFTPADAEWVGSELRRIAENKGERR